MLRYKTETRPGLVALYDIWPGNGVGQFLQPRSPHGPGFGDRNADGEQILEFCGMELIVMNTCA